MKVQIFYVLHQSKSQFFLLSEILLRLVLSWSTQTPSNTPSPSQTQTPSQTSTPSPTQTPSQSSTQTPTNTPTQTPTQTPKQHYDTDTNFPAILDANSNTYPDNNSFETPTQTPSNTPSPSQTQTPTAARGACSTVSPQRRGAGRPFLCFTTTARGACLIVSQQRRGAPV